MQAMQAVEAPKEVKVTFNAGMPLGRFADELLRIKQSARDVIAPTQLISAHALSAGDGGVGISFGDQEKTRLSDWAHSQLSEYSDVPRAYYDRIRKQNPVLASLAIRHGLDLKAKERTRSGKPEGRLIRMLDGKVRAVLSPSYRRLDSFDIAESVLPTIFEKKLDVRSCAIGETKMYIKAFAPFLRGEVKRGDEVMYGLTISSSDVGAGSVQISPMLYRQICSNGMISTLAFRKFHLGRSLADDKVQELLSDATKVAADRAFFMTIRDVLLKSLEPEIFQAEIDRVRMAAADEIKNPDPVRVVELTMKAVGMSGEGLKNSLLAALATGNEGAGYTRWGLVNSFTRVANSPEFSYEEQTDLQKAGGAVLDLAPSEWKRIANVA